MVLSNELLAEADGWWFKRQEDDGEFVQYLLHFVTGSGERTVTFYDYEIRELDIVLYESKSELRTINLAISDDVMVDAPVVDVPDEVWGELKAYEDRDEVEFSWRD